MNSTTTANTLDSHQTNPELQARIWEKVHTQLDEIPAMFNDLQALHLQPIRRPDGTNTRTIPTSRPPLDLTLVQLTDMLLRYDVWEAGHTDLNQGIIPQLWSWCRYFEAQALDTETNIEWLPEDNPTPKNICTWLQNHVKIAQNSPQGCEYARQVGKLWATLSQALREEPRPITAHECTKCHNPTTLTHNADLWTCNHCGHQDPGPARILHYRRRDSQPTQNICTEFGITPEQLRQWKHRNKIQPDPTKGNKPHYWWPWDIFILKHQHLAHIINQTEQQTHTNN